MTLSLLIVTGQSGSGKSTAVRALEDHGYYVVDNMPASLADSLIATLEARESAQDLALVLDARNLDSIREAPALVERIRSERPTRLLYLEAHENTLIRRYSETRRLHPLDQGEGLRFALSSERELLTPLREVADDTLDTSEMSPHVLRERIGNLVGSKGSRDSLRVGVTSFGFKHGLPLDADTVFDVRFLPNPYFIAEHRNKSGLDQEVYDYVLKQAEAKEFVRRAQLLLEFLLPEYRKEGKRYFTLAIGCTGGQHRSVSIARYLTEQLKDEGYQVTLRHRDNRGKL